MLFRIFPVSARLSTSNDRDEGRRDDGRAMTAPLDLTPFARVKTETRMSMFNESPRILAPSSTSEDDLAYLAAPRLADYEHASRNATRK